MNECATRMLRAALLMFCASPQTRDGGARELLRVVLGEAPGAAGGCAVVGAVDGARAADLFFFSLKMILLVGGAMPPWLSTRQI